MAVVRHLILNEGKLYKCFWGTQPEEAHRDNYLYPRAYSAPGHFLRYVVKDEYLLYLKHHEENGLLEFVALRDNTKIFLHSPLDNYIEEVFNK